MSNEYEVVIFEDHKILTANEQQLPELDIDEYEINVDPIVDVSIENQTNIYSDEHVWDKLPFRRYRHRPDIWLTEEEIKNIW